MLNLQKHIQQRNGWLLAADILLLTAIPVLMWDTLQMFDKMQWFGLVLLPFLLKTDKNRPSSHRFLPLALLFGIFHLWLGQYYWAFACALSLFFFVIESNAGLLNNMALYALIFYLPLTRSFFTLFGFYIRLEITKWAAALLSLFDPTVTFGETQLTIAGDAFTVDAGCMGLRMVITGFLLTLLMVHQVSKARKYRPKTTFVSAFLLLSFLLVIASNFFRIVGLIVFRSVEGTLSHELIGIGTLILFHTIPMLLLVWRAVPKNAETSEVSSKRGAARWPYPVLLLLTVTIVTSEVMGENHDPYRPGDPHIVQQLQGFERFEEIDGVCRFRNDRSVVIVKPLHPLSFTNHHPLICWRGDGYAVGNEARAELAEVTCMSADLRSSRHDMKTVWWYTDREGNSTTSEWEWRWNAIVNGTTYYILNFSSPDPDQLVYTLSQYKDRLFETPLKNIPPESTKPI